MTTTTEIDAMATQTIAEHGQPHDDCRAPIAHRIIEKVRVQASMKVLDVLEDVLSDVPVLEGQWSDNARRWYLEGWHRLERDIRARLMEYVGESS